MRTEILLLATFHIAIAYLRNQFADVFALLISMLHFKSINFYQNRPKIKFFLRKKYKTFHRCGLSFQIPKQPTPLQISGHALEIQNISKLCFC